MLLLKPGCDRLRFSAALPKLPPSTTAMKRLSWAKSMKSHPLAMTCIERAIGQLGRSRTESSESRMRGGTMAANPQPGSTDDALEERISRLLVGAVDMHCHSGPSVMARDINH